MNQEQIQQTAQAWALDDARVTLAQVQAAIVAEAYFTAAQGVIGAHMANLPAQPIPGSDAALARVTFCVLTLRNGTQIVGVNYGAIDPGQHDAMKGRWGAREDAVRQIWPLLGFELRSRLAQAAVEYGIALSSEG